jgi:putative nucleotidyltransferase with HDIG domain
MTADTDQFIGVIINDIKQNCLKLPSLPEIAIRVRKAVEDEHTTAIQIAKVINTDPALSARLLRVANSPMYRGTNPIETTQGAITRLGTAVVRNLVSSLVTQQLFQTQSPFLKARMRTLWSHSSEVAVISQAFTRKFTTLAPDQAMLAGLLHDIGKLPILSRAEDFPEIMKNEAALDDTIDKMHPIVGKLMLETWKFPQEIIDVAAEHEELGRIGDKVDYVDVVMIANLHSYIGKKHRYAQVQWADVPALSKLHLNPAESLLALEEAKSEMAEMMSLLGNA